MIGLQRWDRGDDGKGREEASVSVICEGMEGETRGGKWRDLRREELRRVLGGGLARATRKIRARSLRRAETRGLKTPLSSRELNSNVRHKERGTG